jgi:uncharacterized protein (TIGR02145 family)
VPTDADWTTLETFLGGFDVAGGKMKEVGPYWVDPNTGATNSSGFSARGGGQRHHGGDFQYRFADGFWWSATEYDATMAYSRYLNHGSAGLNEGGYPKDYGFSVRLVRNVF